MLTLDPHYPLRYLVWIHQCRRLRFSGKETEMWKLSTWHGMQRCIERGPSGSTGRGDVIVTRSRPGVCPDFLTELTCKKRAAVLHPFILAPRSTYDPPAIPESLLKLEPVHFDRRVNPEMTRAHHPREYMYPRRRLHHTRYLHILHTISSRCPEDALRGKFTPPRWLPSWRQLSRKSLRRVQVSFGYFRIVGAGANG